MVTLLGLGRPFEGRERRLKKCANCSETALIAAHETVPPGWLVVIPYGGTMPNEPLEYTLCSDRCLAVWAHGRIGLLTVVGEKKG